MPAQAITEFQALWKKHYGVALPLEQAQMRAHQIFAVLRLLMETSLSEPPLVKSAVPSPIATSMLNPESASDPNSADRSHHSPD